MTGVEGSGRAVYTLRGVKEERSRQGQVQDSPLPPRSMADLKVGLALDYFSVLSIKPYNVGMRWAPVDVLQELLDGFRRALSLTLHLQSLEVSPLRRIRPCQGNSPFHCQYSGPNR